MLLGPQSVRDGSLLMNRAIRATAIRNLNLSTLYASLGLSRYAPRQKQGKGQVTLTPVLKYYNAKVYPLRDNGR